MPAETELSLKQRYAMDGLVVIDLGLPETLIDEAVDLIRANAELRDAAQPSGYKLGARIQDAWRTHRAIRELGAHPAILEILAMLHGKKPIPFQTLNFPVGTQQGLHSDAFHFNAFPNDGSMCGVWVALEDIDDNNGPLVYLSGSHRLPEVYPHNFGLKPDRLGSAEFVTRFAAYVATLNLERRHAIIKKGQAVIWAANLLHGGSQILDARRTRLSQVTHYFFEGSDYYWTPLFSDLGRQNIYERDPEFFDFFGPVSPASLRHRLRRLAKRIFPAMRVRNRRIT